MKNQHIGTSGKGFRNAVRTSIGAAAFVVAFSLSQTAFANNDTPNNDAPKNKASKAVAPNRGLQASVHATPDPFRVYVSAVPVENRALRVSLVNERNDIFYYNRYWTPEGYRRPFNLAELADGTYTFLVESGGQKFEHKFTISTESTRKVVVH